MSRVGRKIRISSLSAAVLLGACASSSTDTLPPAPVADTEPQVEEDRPVVPPTPETSTASTDAFFPKEMYLCPLMTIQNQPAGIDGLKITSYTPLALISGSVVVARAPVEKSCFSSGFGPRQRSDGSVRPHKGIDLHNSEPVNILAAGDGIIRQILYDQGYGQFIIIDHGSGVFTRYARLNSYTAGLAEGVEVKAGDVIGKMGTTPSVALHLHYEVLIGNWVGGSSASYLLDAIDVMIQPAAN